MSVLVDTSVWSIALRRSTSHDERIVSMLRRLVQDGQVLMVGPIRQELLSGIRHQKQFDMLEKQLAAFPDAPICSTDYVYAARLCNTCRSHGVQGSNTDFMICAMAIRHNASILTLDQDFIRYAAYIPISLYPMPESVSSA